MRNAVARIRLAEALVVLAIFSLAVAFAFRSPPTLRLRNYAFRIVPATAEIESPTVGEEREVTFAVLNDRPAPLRMLPGVVPSGGRFVTDGELCVPPFGKGELMVRVRQRAATASARMKRFEVFTDDADRAQVELLVRMPGAPSK